MCVCVYCEAPLSCRPVFSLAHTSSHWVFGTRFFSAAQSPSLLIDFLVWLLVRLRNRATLTPRRIDHSPRPNFCRLRKTTSLRGTRETSYQEAGRRKLCRRSGPQSSRRVQAPSRTGRYKAGAQLQWAKTEKLRPELSCS